MEFPLRFGIVLLATLFATSTLAAVVSTLIWRLRSATRPADADVDLARPHGQAMRLLVLRALPVLTGLVATVLFTAPAFHLYEPRYVEDMPVALIVLAAGGLMILAGTILRMGRILVITRRLRRAWTRSSRPLVHPRSPVPAFVVESPFPIVALLGVAKPLLFMARQVVDTCSAAQLSAIVDHECAHLRRWDNLTRLLLDASFDPLAWTSTGRELRAAWMEAAEQAADDGASDHIALAEGLVRVAKLAPGHEPRIAAASALLEGQEIERRVRRLIAVRHECIAERRRPVLPRAALAALVMLVFAAVMSDAGLRWTHDLIELAVTGLR